MSYAHIMGNKGRCQHFLWIIQARSLLYRQPLFEGVIEGQAGSFKKSEILKEMGKEAVVEREREK